MTEKSKLNASSLQFKIYPIDSLVEYARNPRKNDAVVDRMVSCIKEFGFRIPIVAKSDATKHLLSTLDNVDNRLPS